MTGMMGGTFDPIHYGHLRLAEHIMEEFSLDEILFVPAGSPPHKENSDILPAKHRLAMTRLAIADNERFQLMDFEVLQKGYSYTADSLRFLKEQGFSSLSLIMGADSVVQMKHWYKPERILSQARIVVAPRAEIDEDRLLAAVDELKKLYSADVVVSGGMLLPYASTNIRARVAQGESIRYLVPEPVRQYILQHGFYKKEAD